MLDEKKVKNLARVLRIEGCILFIGSGISMWSGLPSWSGLISMLIEYMESHGHKTDSVKKELKNGDLLQAASYGIDKLSVEEKIEFYRNAFNVKDAKPSVIHEKIVRLGVTNYITTNYDKLIEKSLDKWMPDDIYDVITNSHLAELGLLHSSNSSHFVFKPHGDIADIDSIILTREDYRALLEGGHKHPTFEALKHLMLSRPIVYLGFGLRDPNFLLLRGLLENIFQQNIRDHYAIMPDVESDEIDYWARNYGVQLIGYNTASDCDDNEKHSELLELLDLLYEENKKAKEDNFFTENSKLAFIRYATIFDRYKPVYPEFLLRAHKENDGIDKSLFGVDYISNVNKLLTCIAKNTILIGLPGAGKSYSLQKAAKHFAERLQTDCLKEDYKWQELQFPVYIDLKQYNGDLYKMIEDEFSKEIPFESIRDNCKFILFLDSFNEMPKEYWKEVKYKRDIEDTLKRFKNACVIIGSRSTDGLADFNYEIYNLDEIDYESMFTELEKLGVKNDLSNEVYRVINKPFNFQFIVNKTVDVNLVEQPADFYRLLLNYFEEEFKNEEIQLDFMGVLIDVAYQALDNGDETFLPSTFYEFLDDEKETADAMINWLIYKKLLVTRSNGKLSFVHQSITEYLASRKLIQEYENNPEILKEKCKSYRWDQTILFLTSITSEYAQRRVVKALYDIDFELALRSISYISVIDDAFVKEFVDYIICHKHSFEETHMISRCITTCFPISNSFAEEISRLTEMGGLIGGAAAEYIYKAEGAACKEKLMDLFINNYTDFNMTHNYVLHLLSDMIGESDAKKLSSYVDQIEKQCVNDPEKDVVDAFACLCCKLSEKTVREDIIHADDINMSLFRQLFMIKFWALKKTQSSYENVFSHMLKGWCDGNLYSVGDMLENPIDEIDFSFININHINYILKQMENDAWAAELLQKILIVRNDLTEYVESVRNDASDELGVVLQYCINSNSNEFFTRLSRLADKQVGRKIIKFHPTSLAWSSHMDTLEEIVQKKDAELLILFTGGGVPASIRGVRALNITGAENWLMKMQSLAGDYDESKEWKRELLGSLLCHYASADFKADIISIFNNSAEYRDLISLYFFSYMEFSIYDLSKDAINYIYEDLRRNKYQGWRIHYLANIIDENYLNNELLELYKSSEGVFRFNLEKIILAAGRNLGKRISLCD